VVAERFQVIPFKDVEHLERGDPLAVRGELVKRVALERRAQGLDPGGLVPGEVLVADQAPLRLEVGRDVPSSFTPVILLDPALRERSESASEVRLAKHLANARRPVGIPFADEIVGCKLRDVLVLESSAPIARDDLAHGKALVSVTYRATHDFREGKLPVPASTRHPAMK